MSEFSLWNSEYAQIWGSNDFAVDDGNLSGDRGGM
jgi:hypothetical protein